MCLIFLKVKLIIVSVYLMFFCLEIGNIEILMGEEKNRKEKNRR